MRVSQTINQEKRRKRLKEDPEKYKIYLKERATYLKRYLKENPRYEQNRQYTKELRETARKIGNCSHCFNPKEDQNYNLCENCRKYFRDYRLKTTKKQKNDKKKQKK